MEENSVQPLFVTPASKKTKKPIFAIVGIAVCFALIFAIGIAVSRNSGMEITQTLPPINTAEIQTTTAATTPAYASISDTTTSQAALKTPIDTVTEDGVPIKSTAVFTEEDKAEILEAYKALKIYFDKHFNLNYPDASRYMVSIDDVRHGDGLYSTRYTLESGFKPTKEFKFWVTFDNNHENFSSSHKNEWYIASKFNGEWTTYSEYMDTSKTPIDTIAEDGVPIKSTAAFTENEKAEILRGYKHLKTYFDEYLSADYPNAGQYITSIDDVRYADELYSTRYSDTPEFKPEKEIEFWVICSYNEILSSSYNNEWYTVSVFNNQWTTYTEYKLNRKTPIDTVANDGVPIKSKAGFTEKEKADILEAYEALKIYIDNLNINYPNGSQYIVSIDDVRHAGGDFHDPRPGATDYRPSNAYEFWVTCDYEPLSSSYKNEWFLVTKFNGEWTA